LRNHAVEGVAQLKGHCRRHRDGEVKSGHLIGAFLVQRLSDLPERDSDQSAIPGQEEPPYRVLGD
jgi:hypothetical protein